MSMPVMTAILRAARDPQKPVMPIAVWTELRQDAQIRAQHVQCTHCSIMVRNEYPTLAETVAAFERLVDSEYLDHIYGVGYVTTAVGILALKELLSDG